MTRLGRLLSSGQSHTSTVARLQPSIRIPMTRLWLLYVHSLLQTLGYRVYNLACIHYRLQVSTERFHKNYSIYNNYNYYCGGFTTVNAYIITVSIFYKQRSSYNQDILNQLGTTKIIYITRLGITESVKNSLDCYSVTSYVTLNNCEFTLFP